MSEYIRFIPLLAATIISVVALIKLKNHNEIGTFVLLVLVLGSCRSCSCNCSEPSCSVRTVIDHDVEKNNEHKPAK